MHAGKQKGYITLRHCHHTFDGPVHLGAAVPCIKGTEIIVSVTQQSEDLLYADSCRHCHHKHWKGLQDADRPRFQLAAPK
jgi:hypothetical protein